MALANRPPKIGQRWLWNYATDRIIVEVTNFDPIKCKVVQRVDISASYWAGHIFSPSIMSDDRWILLEGQEAPSGG